MSGADLLNRYLRQFWLEGAILKILDLQKGIEGLTNSILLDILCGRSKFVDTEDGMNLEDDEEDEDLSIDYVSSVFYDNFRDVFDRITSYSFGLKSSFDNDDKEEYIHFWGLLDEYSKRLHDLRSNYEAFVELTGYDTVDGDDIIGEVYFEQKTEHVSDSVRELRSTLPSINYEQDEDEEELSYEELNKLILSKFSFEHLHIKNLFMIDNNYKALQIMEINGSNGIEMRLEYREAFDKLEKARGENIFSEDILKCAWNSGWLAPDGSFYGCSDLIHNEFTPRLVKYFNQKGELTNTEESNPDRILESANFIKFSSGRWLYMEDECKPSKQQLEVIYKWVSEKAKDFRVCLGSRCEKINLDILESRINCAKEW